MWRIKKWQNDAVGALIVIGSVVGLREPYWKILGFGAVYFADGLARSSYEKWKSSTTSKEMKAAIVWFSNTSLAIIRHYSTCMMLEGPVRAFVSSKGYGVFIAKTALSLVGCSILNRQNYCKKVDGKTIVDGSYDGYTNFINSDIIALLKLGAFDLILNSFEGGISKYPKALLALSVINVGHWCAASQPVYIDRKMIKRALLASTCYLAGMAISEYCKLDTINFENCMQITITNTLNSIGEFALS